MDDTNRVNEAASGRFVLRLPPPLHAVLRDAARSAGLSLNEYCLRVLAAPGADPTGPGSVIAERAVSLYGADLVGVLLYGSWARGEATASSDVDALVVLEATRPVTRALYLEWDELGPLVHDDHVVQVHLVGMPAPTRAPSSVWLEAALDGVLVLDRGGRIAHHLARLRRAIASGTHRRRRAHGQPYWTGAT